MDMYQQQQNPLNLQMLHELLDLAYGTGYGNGYDDGRCDALQDVKSALAQGWKLGSPLCAGKMGLYRKRY